MWSAQSWIQAPSWPSDLALSKSGPGTVLSYLLEVLLLKILHPLSQVHHAPSKASCQRPLSQQLQGSVVESNAEDHVVKVYQIMRLHAYQRFWKCMHEKYSAESSADVTLTNSREARQLACKRDYREPGTRVHSSSNSKFGYKLKYNHHSTRCIFFVSGFHVLNPSAPRCCKMLRETTLDSRFELTAAAVQGTPHACAHVSFATSFIALQIIRYNEVLLRCI